MTPAAHHVRRLRWQARAPDAAQALALRRLLRERSDEVTATMQRVFDETAPADEVWQLPRLLLRCSARDLASFESDFAAAIEQALRAALAELPRPEMSAPAAPDATAPAPASEAPVRRPLDQVAADALRHYLATGVPPAAWAALDAATLDHSLQAAAVGAAERVLRDPALLGNMVVARPLPQRIGALLRWLALLPPALRRRWVQSRSPAVPLDGALTSGDADDLEVQALQLAWPERQAAAPSTRADRAEVAAWLAAPRSMAEGPLRALRAAFSGPAVGPTPSIGVGPHSAAAKRTVLPDFEAAPSEHEAPALSVPLAGLVLLHPYLPRLLAGCALLADDGRSVPDALYPRACALLHALACGEASEPAAAEHQLPLIKLLLGRAPDDPLTSALAPCSAAEIEEVDALLAAVREHWPALRNTGPDTLRLSFLQRPGLLARDDGGWRLRLQTEAFDVLLGLLPWSIGLVRLPWMRTPLVVEWPTP